MSWDYRDEDGATNGAGARNGAGTFDRPEGVTGDRARHAAGNWDGARNRVRHRAGDGAGHGSGHGAEHRAGVGENIFELFTPDLTLQNTKKNDFSLWGNMRGVRQIISFKIGN